MDSLGGTLEDPFTLEQIDKMTFAQKQAVLSARLGQKLEQNGSGFVVYQPINLTSSADLDRYIYERLRFAVHISEDSNASTELSILKEAVKED